MTRLIIFLLAVLALAAGLSWLADRPGTLVIDWEGYQIETTVFRATVMLAALTGLAVFIWSILRQIWSSPAAVGHYLTRRRQRRGLDALSSGMIAIGAGDRSSATRYAIQARKSLPNEPLTHLLRAQAAQLSGDKATARRIFEAMLASPDTEQLGLRGLFLEAGRENEHEAQQQFAERALRLNPKLGWPVEALFDLQCKAGDWAAALETLSSAKKQGIMAKPDVERKRAVLLAAQAQTLEDQNSEKALALALEANGLAPDLVPAAAIAGRLLAARGNTARAAKIIQKTWTRSPHPDLATAYAYARIGDSPRDRLDRVKQLAMLNPMSVESSIALANAAIEAKEYDTARSALEPLLESRLTRRVATLMARIEGEGTGDKGRVREWLARAVTAPRDPAWTADGIVSDRWAPVSPVTGAFDAFQWRVPVEEMSADESVVLAEKLEGLVALSEPAVKVVEAGPADEPAAPAPRTPPPQPATRTTPPVPRTNARIEPADVEIVEDALVIEAEPSVTHPGPTAAAPLLAEHPSPAHAVPPKAAAPQERAAAETRGINKPVPAAAEPAAEAKPARDKPQTQARDKQPSKPAPQSASKPDGSTKEKPRKGDVPKPAGARVFVPPRAPDDPGTEMLDEEEEIPPVARPYRATR